jgi:sugar phosphate isomerase/epimerase
MKVGAHGWVYAAPMPGYDYTPRLEEIFSDLRYAGIDGLELMEIPLRHEDAVGEIKALSDQFELPVIGTSYNAEMWDRTRHDEIMRDAETVVERLAQLGGRILGTSVGQAPALKTDAQLDDQADLLRQLIALCDAHGVVLNLHNHTYEVADDMHDLNGTLARIPDVKLGPDLNWLVRGGVDPVDFIRRLGRQIVYLHVRDENADGTWPEAVGEGAMDHHAIGQALKDVGFSGDVTIELAHPNDFELTRPLKETWRMSRIFVQETMGK